MTRALWGVVGAFLLAAAPPHAAGQPAPVRPDGLAFACMDSLVAVSLPATTGQGDTVGQLAGLVGRARDMGLFGNLSADRMAILDVLRVVPEVRRYPRWYTLLDLELAPLGGDSARLSRISASVVLVDGGQHAGIERHIRHFLTAYTSKATTRLIEEDREGFTLYRLIDRRLPDWAECSWAGLDGHYVIGVGPRAALRTIEALQGKAPGLSTVPWYRTARGSSGPDDAFALYVDHGRLRHALGPAGPRVDEVYAALRLDDCTYSLLTCDQPARAVRAGAVHACAEGDVRRPLLVDRLLPAIPLPPAARWALTPDETPAGLIRMIRDTILASYRPTSRSGWLKLAARMEQEAQVQLERDVLAHLGTRMAVIDYPPHPLGLPFTATILIELKSSPEALQPALDRAGHWIAEQLRRSAARAPRWYNPSLQRTPQGWWASQFGLYGPALAVTRDYLVISYSPAALAAVCALLESPVVPAPPQVRLN